MNPEKPELQSNVQKPAAAGSEAEPWCGDIPVEVYFARELATYQRNHEELERQHMGKAVLIHGDDVIGVFEDLLAAVNEGERLFGEEKFMVMEVGDPVYEL